MGYVMGILGRFEPFRPPQTLLWAHVGDDREFGRILGTAARISIPRALSPGTPHHLVRVPPVRTAQAHPWA